MRHRKSLNEGDTRAKLIDPSIISRGWTEKDHIRREETAGRIAIIKGKAVRGRRAFVSGQHQTLRRAGL